ncbi:MAG: hypothetical protein ACJAZS_000242 [Alteromonas naphthalenivorans]|jgi:hypothetical protein
MKMRTFLQFCTNSELQKKPLILFTAKEYPVLFFATLLDRLRKKYTPAPKTISFLDTDFVSLQAQLSTTFLGQQDIIWCGNISGLDASTKKKMLPFLATYTGPHTLFSFITTKDITASVDKQIIINLDDPLSPAEREQLITFLFDRLQWKQVHELTKESYKTMSLDTVVLLAQYRLVLGKNTDLFMQQWFEKLLVPDESLFTLTQWFFSRKPQHFFRTWHAIKDNYAPVFWTMFWSEQLWRAHYALSLRKQNKLAEAKQMAYRLPFSFLQRDWKNVSESELQNAHDFLYTADFNIKNGSSDLFLEVFFNNFFSKQF